MTGDLTPLEEDLLAALDPREIASYRQVLMGAIPAPGMPGEQDRATAFIRAKLRSWGVPTTIHRFDALVSVPGKARLSLARRDAPIPALVLPYSVATPQGGIVAELRAAPSEAPATPDLAGAIALIDAPPTTATVARMAALGALAQVYIAPGEALEPVPVAAAWGGPAPTPVVAIGRAAGEGFLALCAAGATPVRLVVEAEWTTRTLSLPVATIRGVEEPEAFLLLGAPGPSHHDGGEAAACLLELCRILAEQAGRLRRGVRCAWWPQGAATTTGPHWYGEHHWAELGASASCYVDLIPPPPQAADSLAAWGEVGLRPFAELALREGGVRAITWAALPPAAIGAFARRGLPGLQLEAGQAAAVGACVPTLARLATVPLLPFDIVGTARAIDARLRAVFNSAGAAGNDATELAPLRVSATTFLAASERLQIALMHIAQADSPHYEESLLLGNRALRHLNRLLVPPSHFSGDPYQPDRAAMSGSLLPGLERVLAAHSAASGDALTAAGLHAAALGEWNRLLDTLGAGIGVIEEALAALRPLGFG